MTIEEQKSLAPYTYIKVGGKARFFAEAKTEEDVEKALRWAAEKQVPVAVLGAGSNVLVADAGFPGLVIHMTSDDFMFEGDHVYAGAGVLMAQVATRSLQNNLTGFEWAAGIPGTTGGSVYGNAGCFGGEIKDVIETVSVFDSNASKSYKLKAKSCDFAYRDSVFKKHKDWIILGATLKLRHVSDEEKKEKQRWLQQMMRERVAEQAIGEHTMGSTFKGVSYTEELLRHISRYDARFQKPANACWVFENRRGMMSAGFLIEQAGLKGKKIGGISVSSKHANFLINDGTATAEHVAMLIAFIKEHAHRMFGVMLEEEIQYIGF